MSRPITIRVNRIRRVYVGFALVFAARLVLLPSAVLADECDSDRAKISKDWTNTEAETVLFVCRGHYLSGLKVLLSPSSAGDFMLTVTLDDDVYRAIIYRQETARLRAQEGNYVLYSKKSCFIRGNLSDPAFLHFGDSDLPNDLTYFAANNSLNYIDCDSPK